MRSKRNWRKTENEELTVGNQLATLEEQLNQLIGRDIRTEFKVSPVPELLSLQLDVARARAQALEYRHELREVRLRVKQEVDKRVKKSEYIPDMSLALTYVSPRSFDEFVPKNFAGVGMLVIGGSDHMVAAIAEDISRF